MNALWAILTAVALAMFWAWLVYEQRRRPNVVEPDWRHHMARMALAFEEIERAMGAALLPSVAKASAAMRDFDLAYAKVKAVSEARVAVGKRPLGTIPWALRPDGSIDFQASQETVRRFFDRG